MDLAKVNYEVDKVVSGVEQFIFSSNPYAERVRVVCPDMKYNSKGYVLCGVEFSEPGKITRIPKKIVCETGMSAKCEELVEIESLRSKLDTSLDYLISHLIGA